jgi:hypothetical protein
VSYRIGESIGRRERDETWSVADFGDFTVTNNRVVFRGDEENVEVSIGSIVGVDELPADELAIQAKRRKTTRFRIPGQAHEVAARSPRPAAPDHLRAWTRPDSRSSAWR